MIALWVAKFLPYKWIAVGLAMLVITAWGGIGWYGKRGAELTLERERLEQTRVVAGQLAENLRLREANERRAVEISSAYQKGKRDVALSFQPALADLQTLRTLFSGGAGGVRVDPADGAGAVPGPADPPGGPDGVACTEEPAAIIAAAHRVAQDLEACAANLAQLTALQRWVREVGQTR